MKVKVAVVGNCQARPLADALALLSSRVEVAGVTIVHLAKAPHETETLANLERADVILAQLVRETFEVPFLRSDFLAHRFGKRVVLWPNLFFRGQCPHIRYLTIPGKGRVLGPLGEYHDLQVLDLWRRRIPLDEATSLVKSLTPTKADILEAGAESLRELRTREAPLDVKISDVIDEGWRSRRLFFTFNHPTAELLLTLAERCLKSMSLDVEHRLDPVSLGEPLGRIVPPMYFGLANMLGLLFCRNDVARGEDLLIEDHKVRITGRGWYTPAEFVATSYRCYEAMLSGEPEPRIS